MAEQTINPNEYDAGSPITESLMTRIIENVEDLYVQVSASSEPTLYLDGTVADESYSEVSTAGTYVVPADVTKIKVTLVSGGGGGGRGSRRITSGTFYGGGGAGGGAGGNIREFILSVTPAASLTYSVGAGGSGAASASNDVGADGSDGGNTVFDSNTSYGTNTKGGGGGKASNLFPVISTVTNVVLSGRGGRCVGSQNGGHGGAGSINNDTVVSFDGELGDGSGCVFQADAPAFGVDGGANASGGGGAGGNFGYSKALDILGTTSDYQGGDGSDGTSGGSSTGGNGGTASGGGGSGGAGSAQTSGAGGDGGDGFILIWELA